MRKILSILLILILACCLFVPVSAEETADVLITSAEDFLAFAQNCRLDTYSAGITVSLQTDIELRGTDFSGVPIFSGTFLGNGYTIAGVKISADGSTQGLFRYLTKTAVVENLNVHATITPGGSRSTVGGIAAENAGTIRNCRFSGAAAGAVNVGGIVGINAVTGIIEDCTTRSAVVYGSHFVGGIAGKNMGVIRACYNAANVNATSEQNTISLEDLSLESLFHTETLAAATDIGGIAGTNSGVIRSCENRGVIGYAHMGYNVGGIAGSHCGYITDCKNGAAVSGRKEVGGIVGQAEPTFLIDYDTDTIQILRGQFGTLNAMTESAASEVQSSTDTLRNQYTTFKGHVSDAREALDILTPERGDKPLHRDQLIAAQTTLSGSISGMSQTFKDVRTNAIETTTSLADRLESIGAQLKTIGGTMSNPLANLGGSFTDVSDLDTEDNKTAKIENCKNTAAILADRNAGGIVGAIAIESDLDHEADLDIAGDSSLNFDGELRAVVLNCENKASVFAGKQNVGGIIGWQSMGLIKACLNSGTVDNAKATYVGGIAGQSTGYIRDCYARCIVSGSKNVGGIAGSGSFANGCRSMTKISGSENCGGIFGLAANGYIETDNPLLDNYYLCVGNDVGGIDGISYNGSAQPLAKSAFLALDNLPEMFRTVTVCFRFVDGSEQSFAIEPGGIFPESDIPSIPQKNGCNGKWIGLEKADLSAVYFDTEFDVEYTPFTSVIRSVLLRGGTEKPILLAQGAFPIDDTIITRSLTENLPEGIESLIEAWQFTLPLESDANKLRYCLPEEYRGKTVCLHIRNAKGEWYKAEGVIDGSYLVFQINADDTAFCISKMPFDPIPYIIAGAAAFLFLLLILIIIICKKKRRVRISEM